MQFGGKLGEVSDITAEFGVEREDAEAATTAKIKGGARKHCGGGERNG